MIRLVLAYLHERRDAAVLFTAIVLGGTALFATGVATGYSLDRYCPKVANATYTGAHEQDGRLKCVYVVEVKRQMVRGLTKAERGR